MKTIRVTSTLLLWGSAVAFGCSSGDSGGSSTPGQTVCGEAATTGSATADACIQENCCASFAPCHQDAACRACIAGSGSGCDGNTLHQAFSACVAANDCFGSGGTGGKAGAGGSGGSAGSSGKAGAAGSGGCANDSDCADKVPVTQPAGCAEGICDQGACKVVARDKDKDGKKNKFCKDPEGNVTIETGNDCDDSDPNIHPGAWDGPEDEEHTSSCDGVDQDCSGTADDGTLSDMTSCACKPGTTADCSETSNGQPIDFPTGTPLGECKKGTKKCVADLSTGSGKWELCTGAVGPTIETCDGEDDDCDGQTDEDDAIGKNKWMCDADGDGYLAGDPTTVESCSVPSVGCTAGMWTLSGQKEDCDDSNAQKYPGLTEVCDGLDNDCDGAVDDNAVDKLQWFKDADGDLYGANVEAQYACTAPSADWRTSDELHGNVNNDCVDSDPKINPGVWDGPAKKKVSYGWVAPGLSAKVFPMPLAAGTCTNNLGDGPECFARAAHTALTAASPSPAPIERTDLAVNFDWMKGAPDSTVSGSYDGFAARWTGKLRPPQSGNYQFWVHADDGFRLVVDGKTVLPGWSLLDIDYSTTSNPANGWTYGWKPTVTGAFTAFGKYIPKADGGVWTDGALYYGPEVWKNATNSTMYGVAPGQVSLHPGSAGQFVVARYTVPVAAPRCIVSGAFLAGDSGDTDGYVLHNNVVERTIASTTGNPVFRESLSSVQANDTIEVAVGHKGDWTCDSTPVRVVVYCLDKQILSAPIALDATKDHDVKIEYFEGNSDATARLGWTGPGLAAGGEIIMTQLDPVDGEAPDSCESQQIDNDCSGKPNDGVAMDVGIPSLSRRCLTTASDCDPTLSGLATSLNRECGSQSLVGICHNGNQTCLQGGNWSATCAGEQAPMAEVCNNLDDNCNVATDDGASPQLWTLDNDGDGHGNKDVPQVTSCTPPTSPAGNWVAGIAESKNDDCNDNQSWNFPTNQEICDGKDNNCNGAPDDNPTGIGANCLTSKLGECASGTKQCLNGSLTCVQTNQPTPEICNTLDDDCDGSKDEGNPGGGATCSIGTLHGPCSNGMKVCDQQGGLPCTQVVFPEPNDLCDGIDNNCNGSVDEGHVPSGCPSTNKGVCAPGTKKCIGGKEECVSNITPGSLDEVCGNTEDEDCDGVVNNGCPCATLEFFDSAANSTCSAPGTGAKSPLLTTKDCTNVPDPVHDGAAQLTIYPALNCKPGDGVWLYDYDNCSESGAGKKWIAFACAGIQYVNLNCSNFADKAGSFKLVCQK